MVRSTNLASHHHHIFVGDVESGRPQTVSIQDSSNISGTKKANTILCPKSRHFFLPEQLNFFLPSIRECDQRWSVPRLHRAAGPSAAEGIFLLYSFISKRSGFQVPPVEVLLLLRHGRVVLPGFRNYRHHRLGQ